MSDLMAAAGTVELRGWDDTATGTWTVNVLVNGRNVGKLRMTPPEYRALSAAFSH